MNNDCCIAKILEIINCLQEQSEKFDDIPSSCDKPFLGCNIGSQCFYNTRPVTLYNCNNNLIKIPYTLDDVEETSSVFRVEKVNGCCVTLRVLAPNSNGTDTNPYVATNSFFTFNCNCCCALRCLPDTFVDCI